MYLTLLMKKASLSPSYCVAEQFGCMFIIDCHDINKQMTRITTALGMKEAGCFTSSNQGEQPHVPQPPPKQTA
jgi:hypothetical protein